MGLYQRVFAACGLFLYISSTAFAVGGELNVTSEFQSVWGDSQGDPGAVAKLREFQVVFVKGFFSGTSSSITGSKPSFTDQQIVLRKYGIDFSVVDTAAAATIAANAEQVARTIAEAPKPVVIFSYSKGSLDALEALRLHPDLIAKVKGWWMVQSPLYGTYLADYALNDMLDGATDYFFDLINGDRDSLADMRMEVRGDYMRQHDEFLAGLARTIPILSFTAWKENERWRWDTDFEPFRNMMLRLEKEPNDGVVPTRSMRFPGAEYIAIEGVDHLSVVKSSRRIEFDSLRCSEALYRMLGRRLLLNAANAALTQKAN